MHFGMKSTLKSNRNYTPKHASYYFNPKKNYKKNTYHEYRDKPIYGLKQPKKA